MTGLILAGGKSKRMGQEKALLPLGNKTLIQRVADALGCVCDPVIIVTNTPSNYSFLGLEMVADLIVGHGALSGIHAGLFFSPTPRAFVIGCDMPLVNPTLVRLLVEQKAKWDVVVPRMGEFLEPLHAVYSKRCLPTMEQFLLSGGRRILDLYPKLKVLEVSEAELRKVDPELLSFFNVNTPEDLSEVEALWSRT
jgi:molybdopterin-guanine dinucleotide biosynthesis protein A